MRVATAVLVSPGEALLEGPDVDGGAPVGVATPVAAALLISVEVGATDALRRLAMLRPRKVIADTAAPASPASHNVDSRMPLA